MIAMGAKRWVRAPGAAKQPKTTDQVVAATNRNGSAAAFDLKQAADTAREYLQYRSVARPSAEDPNKANELPARARTAAQTAPVRVTVKPVASEAISEQKGSTDADAELTARAARERYWHAGIQNDAQQQALEESLKQFKAEAVHAAKQEALVKAEAAQKAKQEALAKAEAAQTAKQEALTKAEAARKAVEELLAEEEQAAHEAAAKKAKKDRRKAKKQQQQEEELLQRQQQKQQEEELLQQQHQQQQEEEQQRVQQEMRHQQQLQEEQKLQQQKQAKQKQAKQQAQKQHAQKPQQQAQTLQGQEVQQKLQPQVQELHEDQTQQEWQELQRQGKQQRSVEQPPLQLHTQQAGHAAGGSSTGTAASTVSASKNSAAEQTQLVLSPEPMHVKQSKGLGSGHRQTAKTVRLDHAEPGHDIGGQHERGVPAVDCSPVTAQQQRFVAPHHLLCCPITQVHYFLSCNQLSTSDCRHPITVYKPVEV